MDKSRRESNKHTGDDTPKYAQCAHFLYETMSLPFSTEFMESLRDTTELALLFTIEGDRLRWSRELVWWREPGMWCLDGVHTEPLGLVVCKLELRTVCCNKRGQYPWNALFKPILWWDEPQFRARRGRAGRESRESHEDERADDDKLERIFALTFGDRSTDDARVPWVTVVGMQWVRQGSKLLWPWAKLLEDSWACRSARLLFGEKNK